MTLMQLSCVVFWTKMQFAMSEIKDDNDRKLNKINFTFLTSRKNEDQKRNICYTCHISIVYFDCYYIDRMGENSCCHCCVN